MMEHEQKKYIDLLMQRYPALEVCKKSIIEGYQLIESSYSHDGKLLIAGNGGSASDSEHIAGELMKRFNRPRPIPTEFANKLKQIDPVRGEQLSNNWNEV